MRQFKMPWDRKDKSSVEGQEGVAETASEEDPEKELSKVLVADVVVDNSIIPRDVLASAAVKSGLLGREASVERIQACARILSEWYQYEGHIFSGVVNAAISPNGTVAFSVNEPVVSGVEPIQLSYYKTADIRDPKSGLFQVEKGKIKVSPFPKGLGLKGGDHFKLDAQRWRGVLGSGLFSGVQLSGAHQNAEDKGMTLDINVEERNSVVFAPGVTKTLFDSNWAGEISFEEKNVLGRNGVMGLKLHRSMSSPFTSFSLRMGNNRFGQPGGWQLSFFRDCLAPYSGFARGGGGGGGYANNALGPASSAPDFSTASPAGVPRDLSMLARSIQGAQHGRGVTEGVEEASGGGNSTSKGHRAGAAAGGGLSSSHGVSLSSSWPFAIAKVTAAAGYQQISPPTNVLRKHSSHHDDTLPPPAGGTGADQVADGSSSSAGGGGVAESRRRGLWDDSGAMDLLTLSGGVSRDWRLPGVLRRLGGAGPSTGAAAAAAGSVSSYLDVRTGCLLEGGAAPRPFSHESATLVHRVPVGPHGKGGSWNVTLNVRHQVRGFAEGELGRAKEYATSTAEVRVPLRNLFGTLPTQQRRRHHGWETVRGAHGGGIEGDSAEGRHLGQQQQQQQQQSAEILSPPPANGGAVVVAEGGGVPPLSAGASPAAETPISSSSGDGQLPPPPPPSLPRTVADMAASGGFRAERGQGVGLRIAELIQVDFCISRGGMKQAATVTQPPLPLRVSLAAIVPLRAGSWRRWWARQLQLLASAWATDS
ncbi:conserved unknown protein [Ectocarpus siliculosus]|uniref:Uncharacterized protein n=1 Tax=Ectocarpus siliculosus TaxID=2880 RepID=D8LKK3_ECTSI|nr:conserved unknown protein [Ectocarpus siliculosus]|eukprot:CBN74593.1 conserved unknown protein [Ectocarpus siliculosus]